MLKPRDAHTWSIMQEKNMADAKPVWLHADFRSKVPGLGIFFWQKLYRYYNIFLAKSYHP